MLWGNRCRCSRGLRPDSLRAFFEGAGSWHAFLLRSQSNRMAHFKSASQTKITMPARTRVTAIPKIGCIEPQTGDQDVGVFPVCENGNPSAGTGIAVMH